MVLPSTPRPAMAQNVRRGSGAATPARCATSSSTTLEARKRSALKRSGGISAMANLLTLKLPPQMRVTNSISKSWAERRRGVAGMREDGRKTEGRKVGTTEGRKDERLNG